MAAATLPTLATDFTFSAICAGVSAATAETPETAAPIAAPPRSSGASPKVVLLSFSQVIAASLGVGGFAVDADGGAPGAPALAATPCALDAYPSPRPPVASSILRSYAS